jgi:kynurenine 3-monooxygenase
LIVGTDGAYSKVRGQMMRMTRYENDKMGENHHSLFSLSKHRMNYQQEYIDECYCELHMPAKLVEGKRTYAMDPNHLHIWPRHKFLITAIPDKVKTIKTPTGYVA